MSEVWIAVILAVGYPLVGSVAAGAMMAQTERDKIDDESSNAIIVLTWFFWPMILPLWFGYWMSSGGSSK